MKIESITTAEYIRELEEQLQHEQQYLKLVDFSPRMVEETLKVIKELENAIEWAKGGQIRESNPQGQHYRNI